jgi:serine/threonine protein kinase
MIVIAYYFIGSTAVKRIPGSRIHNAKAMPLASGAKLGPYEIQSPLGAGGMGEVCRARDSRLDRMVATTPVPVSMRPARRATWFPFQTERWFAS